MKYVYVWAVCIILTGCADKEHQSKQKSVSLPGVYATEITHSETYVSGESYIAVQWRLDLSESGRFRLLRVPMRIHTQSKTYEPTLGIASEIAGNWTSSENTVSLNWSSLFKENIKIPVTDMSKRRLWKSQDGRTIDGWLNSELGNDWITIRRAADREWVRVHMSHLAASEQGAWRQYVAARDSGHPSYRIEEQVKKAYYEATLNSESSGDLFLLGLACEPTNYRSESPLLNAVDLRFRSIGEGVE